MAWVATTSFETTDGSTSPTDGNSITGTGDGTGWSGNWTFGAFNNTYYDNSVAYSGTWSALQDTAATNNEPVLDRSVSVAVTSGRMSIAIRKNKTNRNQNGIQMYSGSTRAFYWFFGPVAAGNGDLGVINTATTVYYSAVQAVDTWYVVDVDFDCGTDTYDIYLDGVKKNVSALGFENAVASIDKVRLFTGAASASGSSAGTQTWFDLIQNGAISGPTTVKTFDGVTQSTGIKTYFGVAVASVKTVNGAS